MGKGIEGRNKSIEEGKKVDVDIAAGEKGRKEEQLDAHEKLIGARKAGMKGLGFYAGKESTRQWVTHTFYTKLKKRRRLMRWTPKKNKQVVEEDKQTVKEVEAEVGEIILAREEVTVLEGDKEEGKTKEGSGPEIENVMVKEVQFLKKGMRIVSAEGIRSKTTEDIVQNNGEIIEDRGHFSEGGKKEIRPEVSTSFFIQENVRLGKRLAGKFWEQEEGNEEEMVRGESECLGENKLVKEVGRSIQLDGSKYLISSKERAKEKECRNGGRRFTRSLLVKKGCSN